MAEKVTSTDIKLALKNMHMSRSSYFITECKNGSTYFPPAQGLLKFDGLAITKSYTKPNIIGYEIKVSRGDFKQDGKWHLYLQYCNEFYFVVPTGLVKKEELPDNVGLIYYNPENKTLRTVKKALYRQIETPVGVYEYIIYSRLDEDRIPFYNERADYARDYLADKTDKKYIGDKLGTKLAKDLEEAHKRLFNLEHTEKELEMWKAVEGVLREANIIGYWSRDKETAVKRLKEAISGSYPKELDEVIRSMEYDLKVLRKLQEAHNNKEEADPDE
nr:MmcB family DNA repair protein [uncultured Clostridium sp.]